MESPRQEVTTEPYHSAWFEAIGVTNQVTVGDPDALPEALKIARAEVAALDRACSRFRDDSELAELNRAAGSAVRISQLLLEALQVALAAAEATGGLVDPTVGAAMRAIGYDRDFDVVVALLLLLVAVAAWRRSPWLEGASTAAATLLFVDAWFDLLTASGRTELVAAIVEAVFLELPLAVVCLLLARATERRLLKPFQSPAVPSPRLPAAVSRALSPLPSSAPSSLRLPHLQPPPHEPSPRPPS